MATEVQSGTMPARGFDWDTVEFQGRRIGEVVSLKYGKSLLAPTRRPGPIPVYGTNGPCGFHDTPLAEGPGVILGRKGQGHLGVKWVNKPFWVIDTAYFASVNETEVDLRWFYYIASYIGLDHLKTGEKPGLSRDTFGRQIFPFPKLDEQRAIARVLGALDDKIELNRRMNRTLEELAAAVFRSWFVDFDPVLAKAAGRKPAHLRPDLAALFPATFQDSPLGPVPHGWCVTAVGDEASLTKGVSYRTNDLTDSKVALVTLKSIRRGGGYRADGLKPYKGKYGVTQIVEPGELIVSQTDVTQMAELVGRAALVIPDERFETLVASLDIMIVRPRGDDLGRYFFHLLFGTSDYVAHVVGHANGTTVLHLDKKAIPNFQFARPPREVGFAFQKLVEPWYRRYFHNERESRTIEMLRETLLPRLLSGELRVKQAEKLVEAQT